MKNKKCTDEEIFSMLKKEYIKVPEGLDQQILSKLRVKKVDFSKTRLKIYSVAATIALVIIISLNVLTLKSPIKPMNNIAYKATTESVMDYDIFNDDELLLAYDGLYNEGFDASYDILDEEQDISYDDQLYEDIAFLENM